MFGFKKLNKPGAEPKDAEPAEAHADAVPLPTDLQEALQAALGREVPSRLTKKEAELLAREVATKAPSLQRDLIDWMVGEYARKVRSKPVPKTARPPGLVGLFYVRDKDGNWVPSRIRLLLAGVSVVLAFTVFLMGLMSGEKRRSAVSLGGSVPTVVASPSPTPVDQAAAPPSTDAPQSAPSSPPASPAPPTPTNGNRAEGASSSSMAQSASLPPEPLLPPPPADLPPPPDYEGGAAPAGKGTGEVVVYQRPGAQTPPAGDGSGLTASLKRPVEQAAFGGRSGAPQTDNPSSQGAGQGSPFWQRESGAQQETGSTEAFWRREKEQEAQPAEAFWKRRGNGELKAEGDGLALAVPKQASSSSQTEVVYRRGSPDSPGGIIPPGGRGGASPAQPPSPRPSGASPATSQTEAPGGGTP